MQNDKYKKKYKELVAKFTSSLDAAYRMGYEQGSNDTQLQQMQQQVADAQQQNAQMQAQMMGQQSGQMDDSSGGQMPPGAEEEGQPPQPGQDAGVPMAQSGQMQAVPPQGEELDQYLGELESLVTKNEKSEKLSPEFFKSLGKSLEKIKTFSSGVKMAKSLNAMKKNAKQHKTLFPRVLPAKTAANLPAESKKALSMQESIVSNLMKKWESETASASSDIMQNLGTEALTKKE